jgi:hypothetical protein
VLDAPPSSTRATFFVLGLHLHLHLHLCRLVGGLTSNSLKAFCPQALALALALAVATDCWVLCLYLSLPGAAEQPAAPATSSQHPAPSTQQPGDSKKVDSLSTAHLSSLPTPSPPKPHLSPICAGGVHLQTSKGIAGIESSVHISCPFSSSVPLPTPASFLPRLFRVTSNLHCNLIEVRIPESTRFTSSLPLCVFESIYYDSPANCQQHFPPRGSAPGRSFPHIA